MLSMASGVPCDCCFSSVDCDTDSRRYQALFAPYLIDLVEVVSVTSLL